mmetsp:Transcript_537/g.1885  ORF Transcript_537/g.1885 Transcript_537/m.1885 type:complete len:734 (+) Transcript_537:130-2331(+)
MWEILVLEFVASLAFALLLYNKYGSFRHRPLYVTVLALLGWTLCFYIVFLTPNDVAQASQCDVPVACRSDDEDAIHQGVGVADLVKDDLEAPCKYEDGRVIVPYNVLVVLWTVVYWVTLFLTWFVYPIMQTYSMTGEFTFTDKMRTAIKSNLLLYSIMGAVMAIIVIIYLVQTHLKWENLPATAAAAANAYGLFLLISLLGHGLVNVPRRLWRTTNRSVNLKRFQFEVAVLDSNLLGARAHLTKTLKKVRKADEITSDTDIYRKYIDIMISKCPAEYENIPFGEGNLEISYQQLSSLHEKLMREDHLRKLYEWQFNEAVDNAIRTEDILKCMEQKEWRIQWSYQEPRRHSLAKLHNFLECLWYIYLEGRLVQIFCILLMGMSVCVVWSELLFFVCRVDLSIFSRFIRAIRLFPAVILQACIIVPVLYLAWCSFSSLFKLRLFNYYHITPHNSDANSLLFSAAYLCRLTSPLAYNFMQMAHYKNTAFVAVMGTLDIDAIDLQVGEYFQTFFPMLLLPFVFLTLFNVYGRILNLLSIRRFQFDDDFNDSLIEDGREIIEEEREKRQRNFGGIELGVIGENEEEESRGSAAARRAAAAEQAAAEEDDEARIPRAGSRSTSPRQRSRSQEREEGFGASVRRFFSFSKTKPAEVVERDIGSEAISSDEVGQRDSSDGSRSWGRGAFPSMFSSPSRPASRSSSTITSTSRIPRGGSSLPSFDSSVADDPWDDEDNPFAL